MFVIEHSKYADFIDSTFVIKVLNRVILPAQQYQRVFTFPFFNIVQSQVLDDVSYTAV